MATTLATLSTASRQMKSVVIRTFYCVVRFVVNFVFRLNSRTFHSIIMKQWRSIKNVPFNGKNKNKEQPNSLESASQEFRNQVIHDGMYK